MELYFSPLACSMASRIVLNEVGAECDYRQVDLKAKTVDGADYLAINPMGQVPALRMERGAVLTENTAVLQYLARLFPKAGLAPTEDPALADMQQWLSFISTELHTAVFAPLFSPDADEAAKAFALKKAPQRFDIFDRRLAGRTTALAAYSIVDAYLFTVLNWTQATPITLKNWDNAYRYFKAIGERPSVVRALATELPLYRA
jgi:glutathione S-transferase